ncbi:MULTISPECIES: ABC transporter permease [Methanobacterium]|jgi:putative ABC transport system permease protein|uniref:ABC transporter permease n=1 Tax=Methanobacterium veterum TaxID=408577 RepID=A0A9E4ZTR8_9EURY|nr:MULTISPECIES: ABC transporter permease [Methanobacterium]MCZ3365482.1 ABC transporter permease [Methanobacterium veterum]MCZ3373234.1 ABC transporter permease [Methanobacterium veterum]
MNYLGLIIKNPFRNKTRTSLAIVGIAIGIATIVALGLVTSGLQASTQSTLKAGAAEITVTHTGSNEFGSTSGSINESRVTDIQNISGVKETAGILRATANIEGSSGNGLSISGIDSSKLNLMGVDSVNGTIYSNGSTNEIILGKTAAEDLNKSVGDNITIFNKNFKITGIYETGSFIQDAGAFMSLNALQNLTSNDGKISTIAVKVTEDANVTDVSQHIEDTYPNELSTVTAADQAGRINDALGAINTATWAISLLAIVIGGVGVINTMIMSVYERTREIGVLKAVGWRGRRILGMILGESIVLTIMAAIVGTIIGVVGVEVLLSYSATFGTMIKPVFSLDLFLRAFGIAFLVGIIGGIYPAYRASRLAPTEALRYE